MNTPPYLRWDESGQQQLLARAEALLLRRGRCLLGIAGAPGAGKSTISEWLLEHLLTNHPRQVALVPMDGYHLAQSLLESRGLGHRKGAPDTFDGVGYVALLRQLRSETSREIFAPVFRREVNDAIAGAIAVPPETRLIASKRLETGPPASRRPGIIHCLGHKRPTRLIDSAHRKPSFRPGIGSAVVMRLCHDHGATRVQAVWAASWGYTASIGALSAALSWTDVSSTRTSYSPASTASNTVRTRSAGSVLGSAVCPAIAVST